MPGPERLALDIGLDIPDFDVMGYYGADYGTMKPFHRVGCLLFLSGHVVQIGSVRRSRTRGGCGRPDHRAGLGRRTPDGDQCPGRHPAGGGIAGPVRPIVRTLNFVVCTPDHEEAHKVSAGLSDLFVEVFGHERGLGGRATIGVMALAGGVCFETWATVETAA